MVLLARENCQNAPMNLFELNTPTLLLDKGRLMANIARMQASAERLGVNLRPHLKTLKSAQAAEALIAAGASGITVSTLKEAGYFLDHGITDITYAVGIVPAKLEQVASLMAGGANLKIMTDSLEVARVVADAADQNDIQYKLLVEVDCGDHRGGLQADSDDLLQIADVISNSTAIFQGLLTHAGHSYGVDDRAAIEQIAAQERDAVVMAAARLRAAGHVVETVSVGAQRLVSSSVDDEMVYQITRSLWHRNSRKLLDNGHVKGRHISLATALEGISVPLHAGSKRFYTEIGIADE